MEDKSVIIETNSDGKPVVRDVPTPAGVIRITVEDPTCEQVLKTGAIQNYKKGRVVKGPPHGGQSAITSENAIEMRQGYYHEAAERVIRNALARHTHNHDWETGLGRVADRILEIAMDGSNRDSIEASRFLMQAAGLLRDRRVKDTGDPEGVQVSISAEVARDMLQVIRQRRDVIDAEVIDADG